MSPKRPPRFVADAMLGSLARKLRIFGYDTLYFKEGGDDALEALARKERRVVLTSDKPLFRHSQRIGLQAFLIEGRTDRERLASLMVQAGPAMVFRVGGNRPTRCAVCNGPLEAIGKSEAAASVPPKVLARHRLFFRCASCSRLYWRGKHWERLRRLSRYLKSKDLTRTSGGGIADEWSGP